MPHLDHTGPQGKGSKTGRKLGHCRKTLKEQKQTGIMCEGLGNKLHSGDGKGKEKEGNTIKMFNLIS